VHAVTRKCRLALQGVTCLVHVSALAADPRAPSAWARTKAAGEDAVRAIAPGATIVRPAAVFGPEDRLTNLFAAMHKLLPRLPLVDGGTARLQPLFVNDLAHAIFKIALVRIACSWEGGGRGGDRTREGS
jgi:uncharacterized protein YbjT (DUF2867 family)